MENRSFYNEILTEHNVRPEFKHDLPDADIVLEGVNPSLCRSTEHLIQSALCRAMNSSRLRPLARMARAFSTPT